MEKHEPKETKPVWRGWWTREGLFRLMFAAGAVFVVLGTATLVAALVTCGAVAAATTTTIQTCAMTALLSGGLTLVGAGMAFDSDKERDAAG